LTLYLPACFIIYLKRDSLKSFGDTAQHHNQLINPHADNKTILVLSQTDTDATCSICSWWLRTLVIS